MHYLLSIIAVAAICVLPTDSDAQEEINRILITNVNVFNGLSDKLALNQDVLVEGNLIQKIGQDLAKAEGATVIDGGGHTLMPGLIDAHVHLIWNTGVGRLLDGYPDYIAALGLVEAENTLMRGFTTVRDTGGQVMGISQAIDEGYHIGPRIYAAGAAIGMTSGHADFRSRNLRPRQLGGPVETELERLGMTVFADGVPEVLSASREQFRQGAQFLKIFAGGAVTGLRDPLDIAEYSQEELNAAAGEAKRWNTYLAVHAYTDRSIASSLSAGAMSIEHANLITEPTMKLLAKKGAFLSVQTGFFLAPIPDSFSDAQKARQREAAEGLENMMELAKKYKVKIAFGTDLVGSMGVKATELQEFTNRSKWFTAVEILRQATSINGQLIALSGPRNPYPGKIGVIAQGALADLLLVDGNPLENIGLMTDSDKNFVLIMKDGMIYKNTL
jgi:imidazolonepropionase-like amidohydrolase